MLLSDFRLLETFPRDPITLSDDEQGVVITSEKQGISVPLPFSEGDWIPRDTHPKSNSSPLKIDGCKTILSSWEGGFSAAMINFRLLETLFV